MFINSLLDIYSEENLKKLWKGSDMGLETSGYILIATRIDGYESLKDIEESPQNKQDFCLKWELTEKQFCEGIQQIRKFS